MQNRPEKSSPLYVGGGGSGLKSGEEERGKNGTLHRRQEEEVLETCSWILGADLKTDSKLVSQRKMAKHNGDLHKLHFCIGNFSEVFSPP